MFKRSRPSPKGRQLVLIALGITAMLAGAAVSSLDMLGVLDLRQFYNEHLRPIATYGERLRSSEALKLSRPTQSSVKSLVLMSPAERTEQLEQIAANAESAEQHQARYLLATDLIQQGRAGSAIPLLEGLEQEYDVLAAYVIMKRAQAYTAMGETAKAEAAWQDLLETHAEHPAAAEALYALGERDRTYWEQAIVEFPAHPRTVEIAQTLLQEQGDSFERMMVLVRHGLYLPNITDITDRLVEQYGDQLTPEDWEQVGFAYWENLAYRQAGLAYRLAPPSPRNAYRAARGLQIGQERDAAIEAYYRLNDSFPEAPETAEGLLKLAGMLESDIAIAILDQIAARFPAYAAEALYEKSLLLDDLNSPQSASQARQTLLSEYSQSDAAAELRWTLATQYASTGDIAQATNWARQIPLNNPKSDVTAEAVFWIGKWAFASNQPDAARRVFEYAIAHHPESYYAWRAANHLGWQVGDFQTVRDLQPEVVLPQRRSELPAGSETLQELYQLGQDQDAWALWQTEFTNPMEPTVADQFTDGLMRLGVGDNLDGIFMLSSLAWRDRPEEKAKYEILASQDTYWQALYPFPYKNLIQTWSAERQLNPLLVTALIRQESRFEPDISSSVGAKGLMQVMPDTADWINLHLDVESYSLSNPEDNVMLGTWYLDYTHEEYGNNSLYAVASYNAGPGNVNDWIARQNFTDADDFATKIPFPETHNYVESVFGNYWNYLRLYNPDVAQKVEQHTARPATAESVFQ